MTGKRETFTVHYTDGDVDVYDVTAAINVAKGRPLTSIDVERWRNRATTRLTRSHVRDVNLRRPVIVAMTQAGWVVIDGNHRLALAHRRGIERLPAKRLTVAQSRNLRTWGPDGPP